MARVEADAEKLRLLFAEVGMAMLRSLVLLGGSLTVMLVADARMTLVVLAIASPLVLGTYFFVRYMRRVYGKVRQLFARISSFLTEYVQGIPLIFVVPAVIPPCADPRLEAAGPLEVRAFAGYLQKVVLVAELRAEGMIGRPKHGLDRPMGSLKRSA